MNKTVFDTSEIAHLWAHQQAPEGRNRQSNFYFVEDTIYSYGRHFPIARIVTRKGKKAVLFTTQEYSNSTARHKYMVRRAIPASMPTFDVPKVSAGSSEIRAWYKEQCNKKLLESRRCKVGRHMNDLLSEVSRMIRTFNDYAEFFGLVHRMAEPKDWKELWAKSVELRDAYEVLAAERTRKKEAKLEHERQMAQKEFEEVLPEWQKNSLSTSTLPRHEGVYLRLKNRKLVETSKGAIVPLSGVKILWGMIQTARTNQSKINDILIDTGNANEKFHYPVNQIDEDGSVHAGCHHIKWPQIEEFAKQLGWLQ